MYHIYISYIFSIYYILYHISYIFGICYIIFMLYYLGSYICGEVIQMMNIDGLLQVAIITITTITIFLL
jgi:hypothetical protein